jgi:precorrin-6A/cobalt-precorrin-6A reductase
MRVLILGGTTEATQLGNALAGDARFDAVLSLAGRTRQPAPQKLSVRIGGFGGAAGLATWLHAQRIDAVIDATHPFAAQISRNAEAAGAETGVTLCVVRRPEWQPVAGDHWIVVADMQEAAAALGVAARRVLLTIGRKDFAPFKAASQHHYVIRSVDAPPAEALPPFRKLSPARGPFLEHDERRLLLERRIGIVVTKNSGGNATQAKLHAARALGLPVVMVARPPAGSAECVSDVDGALRWLADRHAMLSARGA